MSSSNVASSTFSTCDFDIWRQTIGVLFDATPPKKPVPAPFAVNVRGFQLGDMVVTDAQIGAQRYERSSQRARKDGIDHFQFNLYRAGGWKSRTDDREFQGGVGQVSILDLSRSHASDEPSTEIVSLFISRSALEDRLPNLSSLHGAAPTGPYALLLAEYIDLLARRLPSLPAGEEQALSRATCEMLTACISPTLANVEATRPGIEMVLLQRAKRFIESHLDSSELTIDGICNAVGASRRTLYRLFDRDGGVQRYVQARRLQRIKTLLNDPRETRRISELAADFGFVRSDHFARAFKQQYGQSASDLREEARKPSMDEFGNSAEDFRRDRGFDGWIKELRG